MTSYGAYGGPSYSSLHGSYAFPSNVHNTPPSSGLRPVSPTCTTGEIPSFDVCFRTGNISVCNGCRNKFDRLANPPHDLVVRHKEWRSFKSPVTDQLETRFGNAYYHARQDCIRSRCKDFCTSPMQVPSEVLVKLKNEHKDYLRANFGLQLQ